MFRQSQIKALDDYLDANVSQQYKDQPLAQDWARLAKVAEELGEAIQAFIGVTGQNPRKGFTGSEDDVDKELVDVALTAILCLQHRTKDVDVTATIIQDRMDYRIQKAGLVRCAGTGLPDFRVGAP